MKKTVHNMFTAVFVALMLISMIPGIIYADRNQAQTNEAISIETSRDFEYNLQMEEDLTEMSVADIQANVSDPRFGNEPVVSKAGYEDWSICELIAMLFTVLSGLLVIVAV